MLYDITSIFYAFSIEANLNSRDSEKESSKAETLEEKGSERDPIVPLDFTGRQLSKGRLSNLDAIHDLSISEIKPNAKDSSRSLPKGSPRNMGRRGTLQSVNKSVQKMKNSFEKDGVKVINHKALYDIGMINHAIFDKTNTLTSGQVEVIGLTTPTRMYSLDLLRLESILKEVKINPEKYAQYEDEKFKEYESYSEKSQECEAEMNGEFVEDIFKEDPTFTEGINAISQRSDYRELGFNTRRDTRRITGGSKYRRAGSKKYSIIEEIQRRGERDNSGSVVSQDPNSMLSYPNSDVESNLQGADPQFKEQKARLYQKIAKLEIRYKELVGTDGFSPRNLGRKRSAHKDSSLESSKKSSSFHSFIYDDKINSPKLDITLEKFSKPEKFVTDFVKRHNRIEELISAVLLCHEKDLHYNRFDRDAADKEEEGLFHLCNLLGYSIKMEKSKDPRFIRKYRISCIDQAEKVYNILGINSDTNRGRTSVVVNDESKGEKNFVLYVKGYDSAMKSLLTLNRSDKSTYNQIMSKYVQKGMKKVVYGTRQITTEEAFEYRSTFLLVSKSKRDQEDNFEKIAIEIEKDLNFTGCLGIRDIVRPDAKKLIDTLQLSGIPVSIFTGDTLAQTISVCKALSITFDDFNDHYHFYIIRGDDAIQSMKRILARIYENLKRTKISSLKDSSKEFQESNTQFKDANDHSRIPKKLEFLKSVVCHHSKSLLINGRALEIICASQHLIDHLKFILLFCDNIIGHELSPEHKQILLDYMRIKRDITIMAVGDGFNDISMLRHADVGIQLSNPDVPLVFSDFMVNKISYIEKLIFGYARQYRLNMIHMIVIASYHHILFTWISVLPTFINKAPVEFMDWDHCIIYFVLLYAFTLKGVCFDAPLGEINEIEFNKYLDGNVFSTQYIKTIIALMIIGFVESSYIMYFGVTLMSKMLTADLIFDAGYVLKKMIFFSQVSLMACRISMSSFRRTYSTVFIGILSLLILLGLIVIQDITSNKRISSEYIIMLILRPEIFTSFILFFMIPLFFSWIVIGFFKPFLLEPAARHPINAPHDHNAMEYSRTDQGASDHGDNAAANHHNQTEGHYPKKTNLFKLDIDRIKNCFHYTTEIDPIIQKVYSLDSENSTSVAIHPITARIKDGFQKRKFEIYNMKTTTKITRNIIYYSFASLVVQYATFFAKESYRDIYFANISLPYMILLMIPVLIVLISSRYYKRGVAFIRIALILTVLIDITLSIIAPSNDISYITFTVGKLLSGPMQLEYIYTLWLIPLSYLSLLLKYKDYFLIVLSGEDCPLTVYQVFLSIFLAQAGWMLSKYQHEMVVKSDYLARLRIMTEMETAGEKVSMLMPEFLIEKMKSFEMTQNFMAGDAGEITVLFCDICDFKEVLAECGDEIVLILDEIFRTFDIFCKQHGIQKIETVSKTYMAAGGLKFLEEKLSNAMKIEDYTTRVVKCAQDMQHFISNYNYKAGKQVQIKIGIHKGQCIFGLIGYHKPQFSLIGDTVNTTSRHCTTGENGSTILSQQAFDEVRTSTEFRFTVAKVKMKGKGDEKIKTYVLQPPKFKPHGFRTYTKRLAISSKLLLDEFQRESEEALRSELSHENSPLQKDDNQRMPSIGQLDLNDSHNSQSNSLSNQMFAQAPSDIASSTNITKFNSMFSIPTQLEGPNSAQYILRLLT